MVRQRLIVGAMSGTSCDGVDAALVAVSGRGAGRGAKLLGFRHLAFPDRLRTALLELRSRGGASLDELAVRTGELTRCYIDVIGAMLAGLGVSAREVEAIGAHGQTLHHRPPFTTQVLDASMLAIETGIAVVSDFRRADCAVGGQGAPLVPLVDWLLLRDERRDRVVVNLGGIANCTILRAGGELDDVRAWDAGPGNCVVDELVRKEKVATKSTKGTKGERGEIAGAVAAGFDVDGRIALQGRVDEAMVRAALADGYFLQKPPKSTDGPEMVGIFERAMGARRLSLADALATACEVTAGALVESIAAEIGAKRTEMELICSGGGTRNAAIMAALRRWAEGRLHATVRLSDEVGLDGAAKEAIAFAVFAACTLDGEAGNVPSVTGAKRRVVLGSVTPKPMVERARSAAADVVPPDRSGLLTEQRLAESVGLDAMPLEDALALISDQDAIAVAAVAAERGHIAAAIEMISGRLRGGGRLFYCGAGTSGRLGVLDAAECPPTFRTDPELVQAIIAGGEGAVFRSAEGAEDSADGGAAAVEERGIGGRDVLVGIAAGGTTPFVIGALEAARARGCGTVLLCCVAARAAEPAVDVVIRPLTGAEVLTGSTRMKAGTATKLVLNAISTLTMVRMGKVFENLMVDLRATNQKLWDRGSRIVSLLTGLDRTEALELLRRAEGSVKLAVVMQKRGMDATAAQRELARAESDLRRALEAGTN